MLITYSNLTHECGVDEAGRGCGSGPVVAGAVILPQDFTHSKLRDSKKMTKLQREEVFQYIKEKSIAWSFGISSPGEIDQYNILKATMMAMNRSISSLKIKPDYLIIDGNYLQWEFMSDRKDNRIDRVFSDICIPNNINQGELDVDFSKYSVEEFLREIMKLKN